MVTMNTAMTFTPSSNSRIKCEFLLTLGKCNWTQLKVKLDVYIMLGIPNLCDWRLRTKGNKKLARAQECSGVRCYYVQPTHPPLPKNKNKKPS